MPTADELDQLRKQVQEAERVKREAVRQFERERGLAGTFTCQACAGSDLPGYIDLSEDTTQGIHDWTPCQACNRHHPLVDGGDDSDWAKNFRSRDNVTMHPSRASLRPINDPADPVIPMPADFRDAMTKLAKKWQA